MTKAQEREVIDVIKWNRGIDEIPYLIEHILTGDIGYIWKEQMVFEKVGIWDDPTMQLKLVAKAMLEMLDQE